MQVSLCHFDPCRVFQHILQSWFEAVYDGWGRNSRDRPWAVGQIDTLAEHMQAGEGEGEKQSLLHRRLKYSPMGMGWQWDPLLQRGPPGTEEVLRQHLGNTKHTRPQ